jgi:hypothetical protein
MIHNFAAGQCHDGHVRRTSDARVPAATVAELRGA